MSAPALAIAAVPVRRREPFSYEGTSEPVLTFDFSRPLPRLPFTLPAPPDSSIRDAILRWLDQQL
jgi:hypothetical protein